MTRPRIILCIQGEKSASSRMRILQFLPHWQKGLEVDFVVEPIPSSGLKRFFFYRRLKKEGLLVIQKRCLNPLDALALNGARFVYDLDDAVMYRDPNHGARSPHSGGRMRKFRRTVRRAAAVVVGNEFLAEATRPLNQNVFLIPTGLEVGRQVVRPLAADGTAVGDGFLRLGWIGSKGTLVYLQALRPLIEELFARHPHLKLTVVCDAFPDWGGDRIERLPWSLDIEAEALSRMDIGLMPLSDDLFSRGKCGFKLLQYMAAGRPTVAADVGGNRNIVLEGVTGFMATETESWRRGLETLIASATLRQKMGEAGRARVETNYNAPVLATRWIEEIFRPHLDRFGEGKKSTFP